MSWEQRNADFCNAQTDAQMAYIEAEREVDRLQAENAELRELVRDMYAVMVEDAANCDVTYPEQFDDRMRELGVEVDE